MYDPQTLQSLWKLKPAKLENRRGKSMNQWINACKTQKAHNNRFKCQRAMQMCAAYKSAPYFAGFITHNVNVLGDNQIVFQAIDQMYWVCSIFYLQFY